MRLYRVLMAPWVATHRSARWMLVLVLTLASLIYVLGRTFGSARHAWVFSTIMFGIANGACWLLLMPNLIWLLRAARRLQLPRVSHDATWSLFLYAALGIVLPTLCQIPQGHSLSFALVQVLVAAGAMLFMALPAYVGLALFLLPTFFSSAIHALAPPGATNLELVPWGGAVAVVLMSMLAWRWHQLLRGDYALYGLSAPNLIVFGRRLGGLQSIPPADTGSVPAYPDSLIGHPDLHGGGSLNPVRSLCFALGGVYLPQTITGRLYRLIPSVLILALIALIFFVISLGDGGIFMALHYVFSRDGFRAMSCMFAVFALATVMMPVDLLIQRWGRSNAELPLLALLPGLAQAGQARRLLLRASIQRPAKLLGVLLLVGWLGATILDAGWPVSLAMLAVALGCLGYLSTMALCIFGGYPPSAFGKNLLLIGMFALLNATVLLAQFPPGRDAILVTYAVDLLGIAWLLVAVLLLWLGYRGWCGLQRRSHPFLSN